MKNLGETLKQARAAKGVEIRDASDATKVRGDFLRHMENGDFDFELPEIYKRGFLRLYAVYLGLDPKAIMADYDAVALGKRREKESARAHKAKEQFFGEITAQDDAPNPPEKRYDNESDTQDMSMPPADSLDRNEPVKTPFVKIAAIILAVVLGIVLLVWLVTSFSNSGSANSASVGEQQSVVGQTQVQNGKEFTLSVIALNDTYYKLSPASNEQKYLHIGEARRGDIKTVTSTEPLLLTPLPGKIGDLRVERNGNAIDFSGKAISKTYKIVAPKD